MAKTDKNSFSRTLVWIVLLLVVVGLGGYGAVGLSMSARAVGTVGDTEIPIGRYQRQLTQDLRALQQQTGMQFGISEAQAFGLDQAALQKVVAQVALENEADRVGISVGDDQVARQLAEIPAFQGFDGKFDADTYRAVLQRNGSNAKEFEQELRADSARNLLAAAVGAGVAMPGQIVDSIVAYVGERRSFVWVELSAADLAEPIREPADADLRAFYDAHPDLYTLPEKRRITYAWVTPTMLVDSIDVPEDELRKLYDAKSAEYQTPERRLVERLVFPTEDEAKAAKAKLDAGEATFEDLAKARGLTLDDINLDEVTKDELGAAGDAVFALGEPGVVGPLATDLGPALFRVNAILEAQNTPFEEVRDELKESYATDRARRQIGDMEEKLNDLLAGGATLEELAKETPLELGTVDYTDAVSDGIAGYAAFRSAAAAAKVDDFPTAIALDDGGVFALRLDKIIPPEVQPYDAVRDRVIADWEAAETRSALERMADELLPRIAKGEDPASFGLSVNRQDAIKRSAVLADVPKGLVAKAFELAPGEAARLPGTEGTDTVALVRTDEVLPADPADPDLVALKASLPAQLDQALTRDIQDAFTRAIEAQAGVRINQSVVAAVNSRMQ